MECKKEENDKACTCPHDTCERHGICCECVAYHRGNDELPMCLRSIGK